MSLFASLRNAVRWAGFDLGRGDGASAQAVVLVDPATGAAYTAGGGSGGGLTDAQLRAAPVPTTDTQGGTREHLTTGISRTAIVASSARVALPTLGSSREIYVMSTTRGFFLTGGGAVVAAAGTSHPIAADERFYLRVPAGHTHIAFIRDSAGGFISVVPVA
jgi:hypothetical protein